MIHRNDDGTFPAYAWPGGYPILYILADGETLCPKCANGENGSEASTEPETANGWRIIGQGIHWEGAPETCAHCGGEIESAYGPTEEK